MKLIKAKYDQFEFAADSHTKVLITKEGVTVSDELAKIINARYGNIVTAEEANAAEVIQDAAVEETTFPKEEAPTDEAPALEGSEEAKPKRTRKTK